MAKSEYFTPYESDVLTLINQGVVTFEDLLDKVNFGEHTLSQTLEMLSSKNILKLDVKTKKYVYCQPLENNEMVILDGNILLPTTIIRMPEKGIKYITRGAWYVFPIDFDERRIIWNIKVAGKGNSTLIDMIRTSVLKERKTKIRHNSEYDSIKGKILPYNHDMGFLINAVGDEVTDITIQFKIYLEENNPSAPIFRDFMVNSEISTKELLDELRKPLKERNYVENIKVNKIYNLSDFVFKGNAIPINLIDGELKYVKLNMVKKTNYELFYYSMNADTGVTKKIESEIYNNPEEILSKLKTLMNGYASMILDNCGILCEL